MMKKTLLFVVTTAWLAAANAWADVKVDDPWVRATVVEQKATGAFMKITSSDDARLVAAASPVAGRVELHEMAMEHDVMRMRPIAGLDLPAGKTVELKPGSYHIMLMGLNLQLDEGNDVPMTLTVQHHDGHQEKIELVVPVRALTAMPAMGGNAPHGHGGAMQH